jgi:iron complex outermembrane receptor protein
MPSRLLQAARCLMPALLVLLFGGGSASAQAPDTTTVPARSFTLSGRVVNPSGKPVAQVSVGIAELRRGANSDDDGRFAVPALPAGTYRVSFQRLGYAPLVRRFALHTGSTTLDVTLTESAIEMAATQVTASAGATTPLTSPQPTSVLSGEALRQSLAPTLGGTLEQLPGLRSWSTGSGIGKPTIRGLRADRVVIAANQLRLDHQQWGDEHGPQLETAEIERVEVIRGPGSVLYGSDALGGVVNVVTKMMPVAFGRSPFVRGQVHAGYGSVDRNGEGGLALEGARGGFGFRGSLTGRRSRDVRTPEGELFNSGNEALTASGTVGVRGPRGSVDLSYTRRDEEVRIHEDPAEDPAATPHQEIADDRARLSAIVPIGRQSRLELNLGAGLNRRREFESDDDPTVTLGLLSRTHGGVAQFHHPPLGAFGGVLGLAYQHQRFRKFGEESLIPASTGDGVGLFAFEEGELGKWRLTLGLRYDHRTLDVAEDADLGVAEQARDWNALSGSAGVLYRVSEPMALVLNVGRGFRAPSNFDLFSNGVHEGTVAFEKGDPGLDVETSLNVDAAVRVHGPKLSAELGAFVNRIDDYIHTRPTGTFDPESGFEIFQAVQGNARLAGYEASAEFHPGRHVHLSVSSDFVRGDNLDTDTPLPWIAPVRALYGVRWEADPIGRITDAFIGLRGESIGRQSRVDPFDTTVPAYTLVHAEAGFKVAIGERTVAVDVGARNLADRAHRNFMSRFKTYALAPGRNLTVRLTTAF